MDAAISLLLFSAAVISMQVPVEKSLSDLYVLQREDDLLKIWGREARFDGVEMLSDFKFVFPKSGGFVDAGGNVLWISGNAEACKNILVSEAFFLDENLKRTSLRVGVCLDRAA